jgi:hypothetical protein
LLAWLRINQDWSDRRRWRIWGSLWGILKRLPLRSPVQSRSLPRTWSVFAALFLTLVSVRTKDPHLRSMNLESRYLKRLLN